MTEIFPDVSLFLLSSLRASGKTALASAVPSLNYYSSEQRSKAIVIACVTLIGDGKDNNNTNAITVMIVVVTVMVTRLCFDWMARTSRAACAYIVCGYSHRLCGVWCENRYPICSTGLGTGLVLVTF